MPIVTRTRYLWALHNFKHTMGMYSLDLFDKLTGRRDNSVKAQYIEVTEQGSELINCCLNKDHAYTMIKAWMARNAQE